MPASTHLVGAYGLHWARREVDWRPGRGRSWQLLGRIHSNRPVLRVCDFRFAAGVYVLAKHGRPIYAGLARGEQGLGSRLLRHTEDGTKNWTQFSWFSFDDVWVDERRKTYPPHPDGWAIVDPRHAIAKTPMESVVSELEALLVNLLYDGRAVVNIQRPRFPQAQEWLQVTKRNFRSPGICHRVSPDWFAEPEHLRR